MDDYTNEDISITNISELFVVKIYKSILEYGKRNSAEIIAKEFYSIWTLNSDTKNEVDDKDDCGLQVYSEPIPEKKSEELENNGMLFLFRVLQYTIENFPRVENILLDIGFNDPMIIIDKAKSIKEIEDEQQAIEKISSFLQEFDMENPKVNFFIALSFFYSARDHLISSLSKCPKDFLLQVLKFIKEIGDNYTRECNEKVEQYMYIFSRFDKFFEAHEMALIRIANRFTTFFKENKISTENIWKYWINKNMSDSTLAFVVSLCFIYYHFLYQKPEYLVKNIFSLLHNNKIPYKLQQKLCASFKEEDYAPIFQYEYEWYCQQNNIESIVPIRFYYGDPVDLKSFGIEDYDFWNTKTQEISSVQHCVSKPKEIPVKNSYIEYSSKNIPTNGYQVSNHLSYPLVLGQLFSGVERKRVINTLYKRLNEKYIQCSSMEYFSYVFGMAGIGKSYKPTEDDYINWIAGKRSLQCLIIKLYRPDGARQIVRNTWTKVENSFLLDGKPIPSETMKLETNHITNSCKEDMNILISDLIKEHTS
ncbi:hypothetical protein B5F97_06710 [Bacteroides clarus]|uniref:Uncharacterized protein n=2 Tax=Bacteroides clarus TaxID=626929 RepID=A0A1Y3YY20_9BACE|nr:hypothetical protein B5F97_06710 [Bacteroides clarus]